MWIVGLLAFHRDWPTFDTNSSPFGDSQGAADSQRVEQP
jgi:hypothetical protein